VTMTVAQHNSFTNSVIAAGTGATGETITLSTAGTLTGFTAVENYVLSNAGSTIFTLGTLGQNVDAKAGASDTIIFNQAALYTGKVETAANDTIRLSANANISDVKNAADQVGGAIVANSLTLDNNVSVTMTDAQHNSFNSVIAAGTGANGETITLSTVAAGTGIVGDTTTGHAAVENYVLAAGANSFTLGAVGQSVNALANGNDQIFLSTAGSYTGRLQTSDTDRLILSNGVNLSGVFNGADQTAGLAIAANNLTLVDNASVTMTVAQHNSFTNSVIAAGTGATGETITLSTAGTLTGFTAVENYVLSNAGNTFAVNSANTSVNITGGTSADIVNVAGLIVNGNYTLAADDTISALAGANISGVNGGAATGAGILNVNGETGTFTMTQAQHEGLATVNNAVATGTQTFLLTTSGVLTAREGIENYTLHNDSGNRITVLASTNVNALAASADIIHVGALAVNGTYQTTANDIISANGGANISGANIGAATNLDVNDSAGTFTMTQAQHQQLSSVTKTNGTQTFQLTSAGSLTAREGIENYTLSNGPGNEITVLAGTNVNALAGPQDIINVGSLAVIGTYQTSASDTISATGGANISGATIGSATNLNVNTSAGTFTMTQAQHQQLSNVSQTGGTQTFELTTAGVVTGRAGIETYLLADGGGSTFTQFTGSNTNTSVVSGDGTDLIITSAVDAQRGALTIDLRSGGNDTVRILNDTGTLAAPGGLVQTSFGAFGGGGGAVGGYNNGNFAATADRWNGTDGTFAVDVLGFTAKSSFEFSNEKDTVQLSGWSGGYTTENINSNSLLNFGSGGIIEIDAFSYSVSGSQFTNLATVAQRLGSLNNLDDGDYYIIVYNGTDVNTADAALYFARATAGNGLNFADTNGNLGDYDTDSLELLAVFQGVGANSFSSDNFLTMSAQIF